MTSSAADTRIRGLRPPKPVINPYRAHGTLLEQERRLAGKLEQTLTVFLAGAECPFACSFCDLWQWTIDGPTPPGALTAQLERALDTLNVEKVDRIKLYNASNFFDPRAVPASDVSGLAKLLDSFGAVTVESHANTIGRRAVAFARSLAGRLEVAIGLESIHPIALAESNKRLELPRFERVVEFLRHNEIDVRVFVLLGAPHVPPGETVEWTTRTVSYAVKTGASVVSIIPVRGGNGELERLQSHGLFVPPTLFELENALRDSLGVGDAVVTADLWDVARLPGCADCRDARIERIRRANLSGKLEPAVDCASCSHS
ncbi:MAG TPA: hypothetical protein VJ865_08895 [Gemmatimonadaceae bacterium]|nr:hypothetical protein [Gemmatimonadaceae bacterium]